MQGRLRGSDRQVKVKDIRLTLTISCGLPVHGTVGTWRQARRPIGKVDAGFRNAILAEYLEFSLVPSGVQRVMQAGACNSVIGVVLAGGLSRRMGGGDKGLRDLAGRPMLAHVIDRLAPQVSCLVLNANGDPERFSAFGLPVVADTVGGFAGPLAGVLAGMRWAITNVPQARWIATAPGDAPLLPTDFVERLVGVVADSDRGIALAQSGGRLHPVAGLWPVALADDLEAALAAGIRKVLDWADRHGAVPVPFASVRIGEVEADPFFSANTPDDFGTLRDLLAKVAP